MEWTKKGIVYSPLEDLDKRFSYAQVPTAIIVGKIIRIFFGSRNEKGAGEVCSVDVDINNPCKIVRYGTRPVLTGGRPGMFDQDGVLPVCVKQNGDVLMMYYGGFSKLVTIPHTCMMGLAISRDQGITFTKFSEGPILPICAADPFLIGSADVVYHDNKWHMIYTSGTDWVYLDGKYELSYLLKYAFSTDGIEWTRRGQLAIPTESSLDAYAKPAIFERHGKFHMYFSKRKIVNYRTPGDATYAFGYATSDDMVHWTRNDSDRGIEVSLQGWDSEMVCYPGIVASNDKILMFYNGNGFGKTGFGVAVLDEK
jgi:hypothetical protein